MTSRQDAVLLVAMVVFWAINFPIVKIGLVYENSYTLLFYRVLFTVVGMLIFFSKRITYRIKRDDIPLLLVQSFFMVILFMELWLLGETTISSSLSSILIYMYPVLSTVFSIIFLKEYYNKFVILGIIIGFSGILLIFFNALFSSLGIGVVFSIISAISFAIGTVFFKKFLTKKSNETTNFYQFVFALVPCLVIAYYFDPSITLFEPTPFFLLLAIILGIPGTALGYYIFLYLNREYRVSTISSFLFLVPAISVVFSIFLLNEIPTIYEVGGLILVSIGIIFSARGNRIGNRFNAKKIDSS